MKRVCPTCKTEYDDGGNSWKKQCYPCYKDFRDRKRIESLRWKSDIYITHPSVTKEELDNWIKENKMEIGWGAEKFEPGKTQRAIWINSVNYD